MDDLGIPLFQETTIYIYIYYINQRVEIPFFCPLVNAAKFLPSPRRRPPATSRPAPSATTFEPLASWLPMRGTKDPALSREEPQRMGDFTNKNCDLTRFNQEKC